MKRIACFLFCFASAAAASGQDFRLPEKTEVPIEPMALSQGADAAEESAKQLLLRTLDAYTGRCSYVLVTRFNLLYGNGVTVPGQAEPQPVTTDIIKEVAKRMRERVANGEIAVKVSAAAEGSASWSATVYQGKVGGELEIKQDDVRRAIGDDRRPRQFMLLHHQEMLADSLIHETSHAFYAIFKHEFKAKTTWAPKELTKRIIRRSFWDGSKPCDHPEHYDPGICRTAAHEVGFAGGSYDERIWPNEETARMVGTGIYSCDNAVVGRILGLER